MTEYTVPKVSPTKYRCTKGHEWERDPHIIVLNDNAWSFHMTTPDGKETVIKGVCTFCLVKRVTELLEGVGRIEIVE